TAQNPSHTYPATPGQHTVALTATNATGSTTDTQTNHITITPPAAPTASFTASPTSGVGPLDVTFTDTSTGTPTSWFWDFGDGATSTAQNPSHTYPATPGQHTVALTATNATGSTTDTQTNHITITPPGPTAQTFTPTDDGYVKTGSTKNYASRAELRVLTGYDYQSFLKFDLSSLAAPPTQATLRLWVTDASTDGGSIVGADNNWSEATLDWNTQPATSGTPIAVGAAPTLGAWIEIDVTALITTNSIVSLGMLPTTTDSAYFSSRTGTNAPQLVVN
ncbi:MAG: PKD repeat protein, partial [Candidatus Poriferisodalaceae bacterium]